MKHSKNLSTNKIKKIKYKLSIATRLLVIILGFAFTHPAQARRSEEFSDWCDTVVSPPRIDSWEDPTDITVLDGTSDYYGYNLFKEIPINLVGAVIPVVGWIALAVYHTNTKCYKGDCKKKSSAWDTEQKQMLLSECMSYIGDRHEDTVIINLDGIVISNTYYCSVPFEIDNDKKEKRKWGVKVMTGRPIFSDESFLTNPSWIAQKRCLKIATCGFKVDQKNWETRQEQFEEALELAECARFQDGV